MFGTKDETLTLKCKKKKICGSKKHCYPNFRKHGRVSLSEGPIIVNIPVFQKLSFMARSLGNETVLEIMHEPVFKLL